MLELGGCSAAIAVCVLWNLYTLSTHLSFKLLPFLSPVLQSASFWVRGENMIALPLQKSCFLHQSEASVTREKTHSAIANNVDV